jgi:hypothetical protein
VHEYQWCVLVSGTRQVWFHVDKESSAHVYIRLPRGSHKSGDKEWYKRIDDKVVEDCCQLVKANSIKGNKMDNLHIVFTPASNLKKSAGNDVGQVGFHNQGMVFKERVQTRKNEIVNRLEKTKKWVEPDLEAELIKRNKVHSVPCAPCNRSPFPQTSSLDPDLFHARTLARSLRCAAFRDQEETLKARKEAAEAEKARLELEAQRKVSPKTAREAAELPALAYAWGARAPGERCELRRGARGAGGEGGAFVRQAVR